MRGCAFPNASLLEAGLRELHQASGATCAADGSWDLNALDTPFFSSRRSEKVKEEGDSFLFYVNGCVGPQVGCVLSVWTVK